MNRHFNLPLVWFFPSRVTITTDGTLILQNISKSDEGKYTCFAENFMGKANSTGILSVRGRDVCLDVGSTEQKTPKNALMCYFSVYSPRAMQYSGNQRRSSLWSSKPDPPNQTYQQLVLEKSISVTPVIPHLPPVKLQLFREG